MTTRALAIFAPFFASDPSTVTSSPTLSEVASSRCGEARSGWRARGWVPVRHHSCRPSHRHRSAREDRPILVTGPGSVTGLLASYCAAKGSDARTLDAVTRTSGEQNANTSLHGPSQQCAGSDPLHFCILLLNRLSDRVLEVALQCRRAGLHQDDLHHVGCRLDVHVGAVGAGPTPALETRRSAATGSSTTWTPRPKPMPFGDIPIVRQPFRRCDWRPSTQSFLGSDTVCRSTRHRSRASSRIARSLRAMLDQATGA